MSACGCLPGSNENGWHEIRSKSCIKAELESWARMIRHAPEIVKAIKARRESVQ